MRILLTGATGFIGSHVARVLVGTGHEVHAIVRPNSHLTRISDIQSSLRFVTGDLLNPSFVLRAPSFDLVVHLAWNVEPGKYVNSPQNRDYVDASLRLVEQLGNNGCARFVAAGTCLEYDTAAGTLSESGPTRPNTVYGECKLQLFHALQKLDLNFVWTRFFYQYGPHEDPRRLLPHVIRTLLHGERAELTLGEQVRDFLHVEDVARAVCAVAQSNLVGAVNIGSGTGTSVRDFALKIGDILGRRDLIALGVRPYAPDEPMRIIADNRLLCSRTTWQPRRDLDTGLRETIDWWKTQT
jgi:UDP-glucuronate decarboxylase